MSDQVQEGGSIQRTSRSVGLERKVVSVGTGSVPETCTTMKTDFVRGDLSTYESFSGGVSSVGTK